MQICNYGEETIEPPPVKEEVENAIENLKNNKSSGLYNVQAVRDRNRWRIRYNYELFAFL
jgi:hypothetical protein